MEVIVHLWDFKKQANKKDSEGQKSFYSGPLHNWAQQRVQYGSKIIDMLLLLKERKRVIGILFLGKWSWEIRECSKKTQACPFQQKNVDTSC